MAPKNKERVLTEKELARQNRMDKITEDLAKQGYVRNDKIISVLYANVMAFVLSIPFIVLFGVWFFVHNGLIYFEFSSTKDFLVLVGMIILIVKATVGQVPTVIY